MGMISALAARLRGATTAGDEEHEELEPLGVRFVRLLAQATRKGGGQEILVEAAQGSCVATYVTEKGTPGNFRIVDGYEHQFLGELLGASRRSEREGAPQHLLRVRGKDGEPDLDLALSVSIRIAVPPAPAPAPAGDPKPEA